ncbi:MAG: hypothetical protein NTV22_11390 [bacterium]|nr:hypothetical protein [bacterium]
MATKTRRHEENAAERLSFIERRVLPYAQDTLNVTAGVCGSGTVACRLWHELNHLVQEVNKLMPNKTQEVGR